MAIVYSRPQINRYVVDVPRTVGFYAAMGFVETFRTPAQGAPIHVELALDGRLRVAWVADPEGAPVELVSRRDAEVTGE